MLDRGTLVLLAVLISCNSVAELALKLAVQHCCVQSPPPAPFYRVVDTQLGQKKSLRQYLNPGALDLTRSVTGLGPLDHLLT